MPGIIRSVTIRSGSFCRAMGKPFPAIPGMEDAVGLVPLQQAADQQGIIRVIIDQQDGGGLLVQIFQGGLQTFARSRGLILAEVDIHRKLVAKHMLFDREGMPGAVDDDQLFLPRTPFARIFSRPAKATAVAGSTAMPSLFARVRMAEKASSIGDGFHRAAILLDQVPQISVGLARIAGGQDDDTRVWG